MGNKSSTQYEVNTTGRSTSAKSSNRSKSSANSRGSRRSWTWKRGDEAIVRLMLPVYYSTGVLTPAEVSIAKRSWDYIANDTSSIYRNKIVSSTGFEKAFPTCRDWFSEIFYDRLFDVHPLCRPMFKSAMSRGSFIHGLLSFLFTVLEFKKAFHQRLLSIANSHVKKGVKAVEYGIIGEVMFYALSVVLGPDVYNYQVNQAWVKIFSSMLRVIVPVAVAHELASNEAQKQRTIDHEKAFGYEFTESDRNRQTMVCPVMNSVTQEIFQAAASDTSANTATTTMNNNNNILPSTSATSSTPSSHENSVTPNTATASTTTTAPAATTIFVSTLEATTTATTVMKPAAGVTEIASRPASNHSSLHSNNISARIKNALTSPLTMSSKPNKVYIDGGVSGSSDGSILQQPLLGLDDGISKQTLKEFQDASASRRVLMQQENPYTTTPLGED